MKRPCHMLILLLAAGCGGEEPTSPPPEGLLAPAQGEGLQLEMTSGSKAGVEKRICEYYVMPDDNRYIQRIEHQGDEALHHLALYETFLTPGAVASKLDQPFDCSDGAVFAEVTGIIYGSANRELEVDFPEDTGLEIKRDLVVLLEQHEVRWDDQPVEPLLINLWYAPESPQYEVRRFLFQNPAIVVPPQSSSTARMRCAIPNDIEIVYLTPHMHSHGVEFRAEIAGDPPTTLIKGLIGYLDAPTNTFDPPPSVAAGSFIDFECDYENTRGSVITHGGHAVENEMCFLAGAYYSPTNLPLDPLSSMCNGEGSHVYYEGTEGCTETFACEYEQVHSGGPWDDAAKIAHHQCHESMCRGASLAKANLNSCYWDCCQPSETCTEADCAECRPCMEQSCPDLLAACDAASCN